MKTAEDLVVTDSYYTCLEFGIVLPSARDADHEVLTPGVSTHDT